MNKTLSIKDIAKMCGTSVATVSRVLNNTGRYSVKTEKRVMDIVNATGYTPNLVARGLRASKMNIIGILTPDITNEFFAKLVNGIQIELFRQNYHSIICNTNEEPEMERKHLEMLQQQHVAGIIFIGGLEFFTSTGAAVPTVYIDRSPPYAQRGENCIVVESDNTQGGKQAAMRLLDRGCKKIVMLTDVRRPSSQQNRINGFIEAHGIAGVAINTELIIDLYDISFNAAYNATNKLFENNITFDGIFASTDWLAIGAYVALTERGIKVPDDVGLVGYDDISIARHNAKPLTTIKQDVEAITKATVDGLLDLTSEGMEPQKEVKIPISLIIRETA